MISMANSKWSEQKEELIESKSQSFQPRRKSSEEERTLKKYTWKPSWNDWQTSKNCLSVISRHKNKTVYGGRAWRSVENLQKASAKNKQTKQQKAEKLLATKWIQKTRKFDDVIPQLCNALYKQNNKEMKKMHFLIFFERWPRNL